MFPYRQPRPSRATTWNQSMVQQLMREGNCRSRLRKASPIGLKAIMMCRLARQRLTKKANSCSAVISLFLLPACAKGRTSWTKKKNIALDHSSHWNPFSVIHIYIIQVKNKASKFFSPSLMSYADPSTIHTLSYYNNYFLNLRPWLHTKGRTDLSTDDKTNPYGK